MAIVIPTRFLALTMLVMAGVLLFCGNHHRVSAQSCASDIEGLIAQCEPYVLKVGPKVSPSPACCEVVKKVNIPCVCKYVTPVIEEFVDVGKVIYVAETCGASLPHGTKCGSVTIPPA